VNPIPNPNPNPNQVPQMLCLLLQYRCVCVYYCRTQYKLFAWGGGDIDKLEDMCYERRRAEACVD
jgi:hypothetical protein